MQWRAAAMLMVAPAAALALLQIAGDRPAPPGELVVMTPDSRRSATSSTITTTGTASDFEQRGRLALAQISYPWQSRLDTWQIVFSPGREGILGLTYVEEEIIEIFVRDDQSMEMIAHVIAHEMGHAVDVTHLDGDGRRRWQDARGVGQAPWWPDSGATDFETGAGDFAESFAAWQVGPIEFRGELADPPDTNQLGLLAELANS
jgi:hypothetical protein